MDEKIYKHDGTTWENGSTPLSDENLNKIETALKVLFNNEIILDGGTAPNDTSTD